MTLRSLPLLCCVLYQCTIVPFVFLIKCNRQKTLIINFIILLYIIIYNNIIYIDIHIFHPPRCENQFSKWYNGTLSPPSLLYTWKVLNVTMSLCHDVTSLCFVLSWRTVLSILPPNYPSCCCRAFCLSNAAPRGGRRLTSKRPTRYSH